MLFFEPILYLKKIKLISNLNKSIAKEKIRKMVYKMQLNLLLNIAQVASKDLEVIFGGLFMISFILLSYYIGNQARKGKVPHIRRLPALDGIDHTINRSAELGKPVYYDISGGFTSRGAGAAMAVAALGILSHVATQCAKSGCRLIVGYQFPEMVPLARNILETTAKTEGKEDYFKREDLRFMSPDPFAQAAYGLQTIETEDCRGVICMGSVSIPALPYAEANKAKGCIAIEGTAYMSQIHVIALATDYNLIGEELYAAGAILGVITP
jgi:hypothetical protein